MSIASMLEVAKTQENIYALADAFAISIDVSHLSASTEVISPKSCKIYVENASADEVVALVNNYIDVAEVDLDIQVLESACGTCAILLFNDSDATEQASLETAGILDTSAKPMDDEEEGPDEPHIAEEDDDIEGMEDYDEEDDGFDPEDENKLKILGTDEAFKIVTRLHSLTCGDNKQEFAHFLKQLDTMLYGFRNRAGYNPSPETASIDISAAFEQVAEYYEEEIARKKKGGKGGFKEGRRGFLSAYMRLVSKRGDDLADAWDALDINLMTSIMSDIGGQLLDMISAERLKRGLDTAPVEENPAESTAAAPYTDAVTRITK